MASSSPRTAPRESAIRLLPAPCSRRTAVSAQKPCLAPSRASSASSVPLLRPSSGVGTAKSSGGTEDSARRRAPTGARPEHFFSGNAPLLAVAGSVDMPRADLQARWLQPAPAAIFGAKELAVPLRSESVSHLEENQPFREARSRARPPDGVGRIGVHPIASSSSSRLNSLTSSFPHVWQRASMTVCPSISYT